MVWVWQNAVLDNFCTIKQDEYVISSKVGKLLKASKAAIKSNLFPLAVQPNTVEFDFILLPGCVVPLRQLQRLGIDSLDICFCS